ncbi:MAG: CarD family transcriptional regulator [Caldilineaceae bacterium]
MEYEIGQSIVHPAHGPGEVVKVERMELVDGFRRYYVIRFANKELTVHIPFKRIEDLGLRTIMSVDKAKQVLATLQSLPHELPSDYKKRQKQLEELVFSGYPLKIAQAVRELTWRRQDKKQLSMEDRRLLEQGRELLIEEMSLALHTDAKRTEQVIDEALAVALENDNAFVEEAVAA